MQQNFVVTRTSNENQILSSLLSYTPGRGAPHPAEFENLDENGECTFCAAISALANDSSLYSVTSHEMLYTIRRPTRIETETT